jgi:hypothetical protein
MSNYAFKNANEREAEASSAVKRAGMCYKPLQCCPSQKPGKTGEKQRRSNGIYYNSSNTLLIDNNIYKDKGKVKVSLKQAVEAHRVVRG